MTKTEKELLSYVGDEVRVAIVKDGWSLKHFGPSMVIGGILETKKLDQEEDGVLHHFRVLVAKDIYAYFTPKEVVLINPLATKTNITLSIPVESE